MIIKSVWRRSAHGHVYLGTARTWSDVALLIGDHRADASAKLSREGSESRCSFWIREK